MTSGNSLHLSIPPTPIDPFAIHWSGITAQARTLARRSSRGSWVTKGPIETKNASIGTRGKKKKQILDESIFCENGLRAMDTTKKKQKCIHGERLGPFRRTRQRPRAQQRSPLPSSPSRATTQLRQSWLWLALGLWMSCCLRSCRLRSSCCLRSSCLRSSCCLASSPHCRYRTSLRHFPIRALANQTLPPCRARRGRGSPRSCSSSQTQARTQPQLGPRCPRRAACPRSCTPGAPTPSLSTTA